MLNSSNNKLSFTYKIEAINKCFEEGNIPQLWACEEEHLPVSNRQSLKTPETASLRKAYKELTTLADYSTPF